jgi:hypothetical protein
MIPKGRCPTMRKAKRRPTMLAQQEVLSACPYVAGIYRICSRSLGCLSTWWASSILLVGPFLRDLLHQGVIQMSSWMSARTSWVSLGPRHLISGVMKPLLYKVPSTKVNEQDLHFNLVFSCGSVGSSPPFSMYREMGPLQSSIPMIKLIS